MIARILAIGGSDSGGGAGIQGDIKTIEALGGYAASAITALTAQNTLGVHGVYPVPPAFVRQQIRLVLDDIGADAVKTGMLYSAEIITAVADELREASKSIPLIVDPVMVAKGGARLLDKEANSVLKRDLCPMATLITPNIPEAEELTGLEIKNLDDMRRAGKMLMSLGAKAVLLKGGHLEGDSFFDVVTTADEQHAFATMRVSSKHTHGTGCALASAIALKLAQGKDLIEAIIDSIIYITAAIWEAPRLGAGNGPLAHFNSCAPRPWDA